MRKYSVIVVDPPWQIEKIKRRIRPNQIKMDYPLMSLNEIANLSIHKLADKKCILFLWTIDKYLYEARKIAEKWGFHYHLTMTWNKGNGISLYGFHRQTEFIIVGLKGKHNAFPKRKTIPSSFYAKSPNHSAKPDEFYDMLSVLGGNRIDLFARKKRNGWDVWGNEVKSDIRFGL